MNKLISLMIATAGSSLIFAGCSVEASDSDREALAESSAAACANSDGTNAMLALIANAMAKELGRWELLTDLEKFRGFNNQEMLRVKASAPCTNGCSLIKTLLQFQDSRLDGLFVLADGTRVNSWTLASRLATGYDVMQACTQNKQCPYEKHKLSFTSTQPGACAALNTYGAQKAAGGNLTTPANLKNALKFTEGNGANPYIAFSSTATSVSIGTSLETEPGTPNGCTEYNPPTATPHLDGAACTCPGVATPSTLKRVTTNPTTPNVLYCRR